MAVAVQPTSAEAKRPSQPVGLVAGSLIGAIFVLVAAGLVLRGVPLLWERGANAAITSAANSFVSVAALVATQLALAIGLIVVGSRLGSGHRQTEGLRGGIFFMISAAFTVFFCGRALFLISQRGFNVGSVVLMLLNVVMLFLVVQFFRTGRFAEWSLALDRGGWFDTHSHKRTQGLRVRRLTMLGLLLLGGTGIWTLMTHNFLPRNADVKLADGSVISNRMGDWVVGGRVLETQTVPANATPEVREAIQAENRARPRVEGGVTLLPDLQFTVPLVLIGATLWLAWRAVNYPTFADFLIATEAEINKVSWSSRKALVRDTLVVLVTLVLLTVFLFVVDVFWGWLLSSKYVGILPTEAEQAASAGAGSPKPVTDW